MSTFDDLVPHEPVYLTEAQQSEINNLNIAIADLLSSGLAQVVIDAGVAALEEEIGEIEASAPDGPPKTPCPVCNPHLHCASCGNGIDSDGNTLVEGISYMPQEQSDDS